ncbi:queuosine precursor transporter [Methylorubrum zatmanii]|uniref:Probable queuosine precursor transporter n=1 Tax=Methylorubrum zatmanii TaxID=29429 RepID=A0ABW1WMR6_9HYPH|nr:queuosine precursor transporter [Methylorubrum zatmanii]MBD8907658.1 transporter [Methylorubrum zatmanii]
MADGPRYLGLITGVFCGALVSTIILSGKIAAVAGATFPASIVLFPLTFLIGDVLTEVYGYAATRRAVWAGLISELLWIASYTAAAALPPAPFWPHQDTFSALLGQTPRIALAGMIAYVCGEFVNAYVLARMKIASGGGYLALRMIGSTVFGAATDTAIVLVIAFYGVIPAGQLLKMGLAVWVLKVMWEILALPISLPLVRWLKRREQIDYFDVGTDFNPFRLQR